MSFDAMSDIEIYVFGITPNDSDQVSLWTVLPEGWSLLLTKLMSPTNSFTCNNVANYTSLEERKCV